MTWTEFEKRNATLQKQLTPTQKQEFSVVLKYKDLATFSGDLESAKKYLIEIEKQQNKSSK